MSFPVIQSRVIDSEVALLEEQYQKAFINAEEVLESIHCYNNNNSHKNNKKKSWRELWIRAAGVLLQAAFEISNCSGYSNNYSDSHGADNERDVWRDDEKLFDKIVQPVNDTNNTSTYNIFPVQLLLLW